MEETFGNFAMRLKSFHQMSKVDELVIVVWQLLKSIAQPGQRRITQRNKWIRERTDDGDKTETYLFGRFDDWLDVLDKSFVGIWVRIAEGRVCQNEDMALSLVGLSVFGHVPRDFCGLIVVQNVSDLEDDRLQETLTTQAFAEYFQYLPISLN